MVKNGCINNNRKIVTKNKNPAPHTRKSPPSILMSASKSVQNTHYFIWNEKWSKIGVSKITEKSSQKITRYLTFSEVTKNCDTRKVHHQFWDSWGTPPCRASKSVINTYYFFTNGRWSKMGVSKITTYLTFLKMTKNCDTRKARHQFWCPGKHS